MPDALADLALLDGVPSAVAAATDAVEAVLRDRGPRRFPAEERSRLRTAAAVASAGLTDDPERWRAGALRLATELDPLARLVRTAPGQALARAHLLVARGVLPEQELGRVEGPAAAQRLGALAGVLTTPTTAPAVLVAAIAHAEVSTSGAFGAAGGLIARAVERLVLIQTGLDPYGVLPVEVGHLRLGPEPYASALRGYASGTGSGVGRWINWCAEAVTAAADACGPPVRAAG